MVLPMGYVLAVTLGAIGVAGLIGIPTLALLRRLDRRFRGDDDD